MSTSAATELQSRCDLLRSLHRPGAPLLLPNVWDVATARAVVAAGFPVVATTSAAVAATLGYEDVLWETDALRRFTSEISGPVNVARMPEGPPVAELAAVGVARVSWGPFLHRDAMARFKDQLGSLEEQA